MQLKSICSLRKQISWPSYHIVYEWEDVLCDVLGVPIDETGFLKYKFDRFVKKVGYKLRCNPFRILHRADGFQFIFEMSAMTMPHNMNRKEIIPAIIDFHVSKEQLGRFQKAYCYNPIVLISSREAYEVLRQSDLEFKYRHFPLSLPDHYAPPPVPFEKKWDLVLMGRQDPFLMECLSIYCKRNPDFVYVYRESVGESFPYKTNKGEFVANVATRESYIELIRQSRIGFYTTPGIGEDEDRTKGFSQVTPRFLELIACGCNVLARFPENEDTRFFELSSFCDSIQSYEQFEFAMEAARHNVPDLVRYAAYLKNHYTSSRAQLLAKIMSSF